jgi:tetraacyldisaccharide 4'-kinase
MMADHLGDGVIVMSGKDRVKAARRAVDELGAGVLILDDSFQYLRLAKDLEFLLLHEDDLRGHIQPLPLGPFREPLTSARWADLIVLVRGLHTDGRKIPEMPLPLLGKKIVEARPKSVRYRSVWPEMRDVEPEELRGKRILAFASIARASSFREILRTLDPAEEELIDFPDHHNYARAELIEMSRRAREKAAIVLTTEKDRVKVDWKLFRDTQCFTALPRYGVFEEDSDLRRAVDSLLSCGGSCAI